MDDLISRQAAIEAVQHAFDRETLLNSFVRKVAVDALKTMQSAQLDIIRCKECKHHHRDNSGLYYCGRKEYGYGWGLNDFCSDAERKTVMAERRADD